MSSIAVGVTVLCAAFLAWVGARTLVRVAERRIQVLDFAGGDPRKLHTSPTPRVGGIAVAAGVLGGILASMGFVLLDARITQIDLPFLDHVLQVHAFSFAFTVFAVTGVANAMNVIDGLNGLSGVTALLASIGLALVAWMVGDVFVFHIAWVLAGAIGGFLAVNFPSGRIFLGDGGAYLIGLLLALLSVMLVQRNVEVSPWLPLTLLAYPVWETLFSMYRRKARGRSTGSADALHLHTLVYRRIVRGKGPGAHLAMRNSAASLCLWVIPLAGFVIALAFWNRSLVLQAAAIAFTVFYVAIYRRIVRFQVPRWLVAGARRLGQR